MPRYGAPFGSFPPPGPLLTHTAKRGSGASVDVTTDAISSVGGSLIVIGLGRFSGGTGITISDSQGNTWTPLTQSTLAGPAARLFYVENPTTNAAHTFTVSGTDHYGCICVAVFQNTLTSGAFDVESAGGGANSGTTFQPGTLTPSQNNSILVTAVGVDSNVTFSIDSSFTILDQFGASGNYGAAMAYKVQGTAGADNPTWTTSVSTGLAAVMAAFKPV